MERWKAWWKKCLGGLLMVGAVVCLAGCGGDGSSAITPSGAADSGTDSGGTDRKSTRLNSSHYS